MNTLPHWWQNGVIYQIYPKSFQDTTGSGTGDLRGVTSRLDYLQKLGVDAIWLTPFYVSPQVDNGYDVANYTAIDPTYGTLDDFDELVAQAKARGIRIVLDMVFNHTSTAHAWFRESLNKASPYRQFYIWRDGEPTTPPNNWRSKFGGNAWQWHAESGQYYLHLFAAEQADLNWENPAVRAELKKVCEFWADRGVDGLRLDVVNLISKDQTFPSDTQGDGRRFYTDGPFWCNHDQPRIVSRFGDEGEYRVPAAKMLAMVLHGMQGTPYIYQGEEIGMTNPHFSQIGDYRDVESHNMFIERSVQGQAPDELLAILASKSRDNSRTPMQWDARDQGGFTAGEPWIALCDNYRTINVEAALADADSVFYTYQRLIALRKTTPVLTWGDYLDLLPEHPSLWCYRRQWQGKTLVVAANLSREFQSWQPEEVDGDWQVLMSNYAEAANRPAAMTLRPFEAVWWLQA